MTGVSLASQPARRRGRLARVGVLAAVALAGAACGTSAATRSPSTTAPARSSAPTTTTATTTTTTTTTTTLPRPVRLQGTGLTGAGASLTGTPGPTASYGPVERILVRPVPAGASEPPPTATVLPNPPGSLELAFNQLGSGPNLVLVEGEHASMTSWDPAVVQALAQHFTVTLFDLPGVGYSAPDQRARSVESLADVTAGLLYALGLSQPTVLGWGLGGQVALSLAERHPGLVDRLVLVDTTAAGPAAPRPAPAVAALLASPSATIDQLVDLEIDRPAGRQALLARLAAYAPDDLTTAAIKAEAAIEAASYRDPTVAAQLSEVRAPALVVSGSRDGVVPPAASSRLVAGLPHARALFLPRAGYGVLSEDESRVVRAIVAFTG